MDAKTRDKYINHLFEEIRVLLDRKGKDYNTNDDVNGNFQVVADELGKKASKYFIWYVYFQKHLQALRSFIGKNKLESEGIKGRIMDLIGYLAILYTMLCEDGELDSDVVSKFGFSQRPIKGGDCLIDPRHQVPLRKIFNPAEESLPQVHDRMDEQSVEPK